MTSLDALPPLTDAEIDCVIGGATVAPARIQGINGIDIGNSAVVRKIAHGYRGLSGMQQATSRAEPFARDQFGKPVIPLETNAVYGFASLLRQTEELLLHLFDQGLLSGTTHTCLGQELCQIALVRALNHPDDFIVSNHRNHGHFLTYSGDFLGLVAEIMGREAGVCGGMGGSQHLAFRNFHSNGVQGGMTAIAVGKALALQQGNSAGIAAAFIGDGTLGQGLVYESFNLAAVLQAPVLFVVENNGIAQTTETSRTLGGSILARGPAFGIPAWSLDDADPQFLARSESIVAEVRERRRPGLLVIQTERLGPHSKGDDLRGEEEKQRIAMRDPLQRLRTRLPKPVADLADQAARQFLQDVQAAALVSPAASHPAARRHIFRMQAAQVMKSGSATGERGQTVRAALNASLQGMLATDQRVLLLGEDLHEPYGGAFKVTKGLSVEYPDRVISTPISEAGIVGAGIGLAMAGSRPVVEIMFADFVTLALDQLYNHAVKFPGMFEHGSVPLVIRTPAGGRRGYGPTHSQNPESLLMAVPGLTVVFPSQRHTPGESLRRAVLEWPYPTVFLEHKLLYSRTVDSAGYRELPSDPHDPAAHLFPALIRGSENPDVTLVCFGDGVTLAEAAAQRLAEEELAVEIVAPSLLSPFPRHTLCGALLSRRRVVAIEEAPEGSGFSAELAAALLAAGFRGQFARVAPPPVPIPAARSLEAQILPSLDGVIAAVTALIMAQPEALPKPEVSHAVPCPYPTR